ncbi:tetratricopeptide repeat protein [Streptomyces goshikiensis]|uniref:tetratricopeptide repeat protein n=1 Tax=Streptomyces goshikiensis TaxID=1942 RepID=UPI0036A17D28
MKTPGEISRSQRVRNPRSARIRRSLIRRHPTGHLSDLAISLNNLGNRLSSLGRWDESVVVSKEAVDHYLALARDKPDAYLPLLARALSNHSVDLGEVGRADEGLPVVEEAVTIRRSLVRENSAAHLPGLAASLLNLAQDLGAAGRRREGLAAAEEAAGYYGGLARANPGAFGDLLSEARETEASLRPEPAAATDAASADPSP